MKLLFAMHAVNTSNIAQLALVLGGWSDCLIVTLRARPQGRSSGRIFHIFANFGSTANEEMVVIYDVGTRTWYHTSCERARTPLMSYLCGN